MVNQKVGSSGRDAPDATTLAQNESAVDDAVRFLLDGILGGTFGPKARLPSERDLAQRLGLSRISVRTALQRLAKWRVIGIRVRARPVVYPQRYWSIDVLPAYLRHTAAQGHRHRLVAFIADAMELRRSLVMDRICGAAGRMTSGALAPARRAVKKAWAARHVARQFLVHDLEMERHVLEAAGLLASLWLLNSLAEVEIGVIESVATRTPVLDSYLTVHMRFLDTLEQGNEEEARSIIGPYLDALEERMLASLVQPGL